MDKELRRGFKYSVMVHAALLVLALTSGVKLNATRFGFAATQDEQGEKDSTGKNGDALSNSVEVEILPPPSKSTNETAEADQNGLLAKAPHAEDECPSFFGGIGVYLGQARVQDRPVTVITGVVAGYPADKLGLLVGDEIRNPEQVKGEVGTPVTLRIYRFRTNQQLTLQTYRDKICTSKAEENR